MAPALTADEIDDVLYFTRVNEVEDLKAIIAELAPKYGCEQRDVVEAAVDPENGNSALHYCAANGLSGKKIVSQGCKDISNNNLSQTSSPS